MSHFSSCDESLDQLLRSGWSVGEVCAWRTWLVSGTNGENRIEAEGRTQSEAWYRACQQAESLGMLTRPR
jgi:hypothetical protein